MSADRQAGRLSVEQQAAALSEWGRAGSFRCCVCDAERTDRPGATVPTLFGFYLGACYPCAAKMTLSPAFRRKALDRAQDRALRALYQRAADLVGITGAALLDALPGPLSVPDGGRMRAADVRLNLSLGSLETAVAHVLGAGRTQ